MTKEDAYKEIDEQISQTLKKVDSKYWHAILDDLQDVIDRKHRCFITVGFDEDNLKKWFS